MVLWLPRAKQALDVQYLLAYFRTLFTEILST